jgi:DUF971 family protein
MTDPRFIPVEIEALNRPEIRVRWKDGAETRMPSRALRLLCPCATCVDETTGRRVLDPATVRDDVRAVKIEPVGRYAIQILWSDGHGTGIYDFRRLRERGEGGAGDS